eukprot:GEZU01010013.1.p1 GENE.GEZU01010013.1~~GEZU01010013.1.p1  ORF type:complete len:345 (-),score=57.92 GEZU01010013.1:17-1051(-)
MLAILVLFGCLGLLIAGAWCVSEGGDILGEKYDATIVGGFMIAWLNTAPETIFFITALESGNPNFAVGAISGSVIVVCTIAVGACIYFGGIAHRSQTVSLFLGVRRQAYVLGASLAVIALVLMFGFVAEIGFLGIMAYLGFIAYTLLPKFGGGGPMPDFEGAKGSNWDIEAAEGGAHHHEEAEEDHPAWKGFAYLAAGGLLIYMFSEPFINSVVEIGNYLNINPIVLAFFFAPVASEAPEILESISLSRKGKPQNINIAFSNLIGGTISKTTLLTGILCLYGEWRGFPWVSPAYTVNLSLVLICAAAAASFGLSQDHHAVKGQMLGGLFVAVGLVQYLASAYMA